MVDSTVSIGGYLLTQGGLLALYYGANWHMPWWVTWFPSIATGCALVVVLLIMVVAGLTS